MMATTMLKVIGGNGQCHCVHVDTLMKQIETFEQRFKDFKPSNGLNANAADYIDPFSVSDPWGPRRPGGDGGDGGGGG